MIGRIYCVTNTSNGKQYFGKTRFSVAERWKRHLKIGSKPSVLQRAILKYGKDMFLVKEAAVAASLEELNSREQQFIASFRTLVPYGYNVSGGGDGAGIVHEQTRLKLRDAIKAFCATEAGRLAHKFSDERRAQASARMNRMLQADPNFRARLVAPLRTPESIERARTTNASRERKSRTMTERERKAVAVGMAKSERWANAKDRLAVLRNSPEYKKRMSDAMRAKWACRRCGRSY